MRKWRDRDVARLAALVMMAISVRALHAQDPVASGQEGNNAVWNGSKIAPSTAYIDASAFYKSSGLDICQVINNILRSIAGYGTYPLQGAVIDARGIVAAKANLPLACTVNPFNLVNVTNAPPTTILLPGTRIAINATWTLPSNTKVIGEGRGSVTQLEIPIGLANGPFPGPAMIQMCPGTSVCTGVVIEHVRLVATDDQTTPDYFAVDGIDNINAQDGSYVNDVSFANFGALSTNGTIPNACSPNKGTVNGLCIGTKATYSGPYTNLGFSGSTPPNCNGDTCKQTACVKIQAQTRGLHGISCTGTAHQGLDAANWPSAAIYLDSYNNTVDDVHVEGFYDGVVVGDNFDGVGGQAAGDVIANITSANGFGQVQNTVHICNPQWNLQSGNPFTGACSMSSLAVSNLTVLNALSNGAKKGFMAQTIQDDNMSWQSAINSSVNIAYVGLYAVGQPVLIGTSVTYPRLTTSSGTTGSTGSPIPTWAVGSAAPSSPCTNGSVYTNTSGTPDTIYACSGGNWAGVK